MLMACLSGLYNNSVPPGELPKWLLSFCTTMKSNSTCDTVGVTGGETNKPEQVRWVCPVHHLWKFENWTAWQCLFSLLLTLQNNLLDGDGKKLKANRNWFSRSGTLRLTEHQANPMHNVTPILKECLSHAIWVLIHAKGLPQPWQPSWRSLEIVFQNFCLKLFSSFSHGS